MGFRHRRDYVDTACECGESNLANTPESADIDHLGLTLRLADLLRFRLPADMAGKLMALSDTTLGTALASRQVALNTALVLRPLPEAIQSFNRLCESDCLAGRTQLLDTWLTCHTELMVVQLHAKLRLSINTRTLLSLIPLDDS